MYPHRFRHTYACQLLDNGAPLEFIQGLLGHEKASTTQIYAQLRGNGEVNYISVLLACVSGRSFLGSAAIPLSGRIV